MADHGSAKAAGNAPKGPGLAYYILAFMGLTSVFVVAAALGAIFWMARPINKIPETNRLADALEMVLRDNYIPAQNIERTPPAEQAADRDGRMTRWSTHDFQVTLPAQLNSEGFKNQLRKDMSTYFVRLTDQERDPETNYERIAFYLDDLPIAEMTLVPPSTITQTAARSDLRNASDQVANLVAAFLESVPAAAQRAPTEEQADLGALWHYTQFHVELPPGVTPGKIKGDLEAQNTLPDIEISTDPENNPGVDVLLTIAGKPCVGLTCTITPDRTAVHTEPVSLDDILEGHLMGSAPDEDATIVPPELMEPAILTPLEPDAAVTTLASRPRTPSPAPVTRPLEKRPDTPARIAIIIDDGGNSSKHAERFLALDNRLTLAILPNTPFATETAERGGTLGFEIMLHMPMETESASEEAVPGTLFTAMGEAEIRELTNKAIDQIPYITGVNNHTGSKFTSNKKKMEIVLDVINERGLFFVDSVTKHTSVAFATALEKGVPAARRDVFLDNEATEANVRRQLDLLLQMARDKGSAIGIGHFQSRATAAVLAAEIPKFAEANITLVHASELLQ